MDKIIEISGSDTVAQINTANMQLFSLSRRNQEVMWGGGAPEELRPKSGWPNSELTMAPIVGSAPKNRILVNGTSYPMQKHGLSRDMTWEVSVQGNDYVLMQQHYKAYTRMINKRGDVSVFPNDFDLEKSYVIDREGSLQFTLQVINPSMDLPLFYCAGWHPAFLAPKDSLSTIMVFGLGGNDSTTIELGTIKASEGNVVVSRYSDEVVYKTATFSVHFNHNFGNTQLWNKGEGYVAIEPITALSPSRMEGSAELDTAHAAHVFTELGPQEKRIYVAIIEIND